MGTTEQEFGHAEDVFNNEPIKIKNGVHNIGYRDDDDAIQPPVTQNGSDGKIKKKENKEDQPLVSVRELFRYATPVDWLLMFIGSVAAALNGALQPVSFIVFGELIDKFIENDKGEPLDINEEMSKFGLYYVYIALGSIVFGYIQNSFWLIASINQGYIIRTKAFNSILRQDIGWFDTNDAGELSTRLTDDVTKIQNGIGDKIGSLLQAVFMLLVGVGIGFGYGWKLTLVIIALSPLLFIGAFATGKVIGIITSQEQTSYAKAGAIAEEIFSAIRTVMAFGGEQKEIARYKENLKEAEKAGVKKGISTGFAFALFNILLFGSMALGFWYGGKLVGTGELTGGTLIIVFFSIMMGANQFGQVGPNIEHFSSARGSAYYIYKLIERAPLIDSSSQEGSMPEITGDISFVKCEFNYPSRPEIPVLKRLSLNIKRGTTCALVGESGCGKSTTVKLVQRFYDVANGGVYIDNNDIKDINVKYLRQHIGVVSQEPVLFDTTIKANILMGNPKATEGMVIKAAKNANAHEFISKLPEGYDTNVGEGGAQLSGGQKQRIAIARALIRDPKILLLDEATSALDTESETVVQAALEKASEGRTTIVIAHRLSTIRNADMIAVVSNGQIVETGRHQELLEKRGEYFKLVMLQNFEESEEDELKEEAGSIISEAEREELITKKMMRQISQISQKPFDEEQLKTMVHDQLTRTASLKRAKSSKRAISPASTKGKNEQKVSKKEDDKEITEEELRKIPPMTRIMKLNAKEWPFILFGVLFSAISGGMPVAFAIILAEILQSFATTDKDKLVNDMEFWSLMFMVLGFVIGIAYFIAQYLFAVAGETLTTRLREMAFTAVLRQEIAYFDKPENGTGALAARLASDASAVQGATSTRLNTLAQVTVTGLTSLIVAFYFSWKLTLLVLAFVPFMAVFGAVQTKLNTSFAADAQKNMIQAGSVATEAIMQIRTVTSLGKEDYFKDKYMSLLLEPTKQSVKSAHFFGLLFGFSMGVMFFSNAACFRLGGYLAVEDKLNLADIIKVIISIQFGAMTAGQISSFAPDYVKAKVSAGRILELFDRVPEIDTYSIEGKKEEIKGDIEFTNIKFSYPTRPNIPILQGLSLSILKGQTVAFVGQSGCGKSTSVSLIERFYSLGSGCLKIDGIPIEEYNIRYLRSQIGMVQQEPVLFDRSIRDNILYGIEQPQKITEQQIDEACKSANIYHVIMNLPNGYNTNVGDKGVLISGGQKQRIAIARALIRDPKILLLDEATSALDSESEKVVQDALDHAMEGRTSIVIAHRLSTIQNADVIAVIQDGKIIELGNHHELLSLKGAYYLLTEAQV